MCNSCYIEAGSPSIVDESTIAAAKLVHEVYKYSAVGGNAHIVVDDWNLEDSNIRWCLDEALRDNIHEAGPRQLAAEKAALEALLALDERRRYSAMAIHEGIIGTTLTDAPGSR